MDFNLNGEKKKKRKKNLLQKKLWMKAESKRNKTKATVNKLRAIKSCKKVINN